MSTRMVIDISTQILLKNIYTLIPIIGSVMHVNEKKGAEQSLHLKANKSNQNVENFIVFVRKRWNVRPKNWYVCVGIAWKIWKSQNGRNFCLKMDLLWISENSRFDFDFYWACLEQSGKLVGWWWKGHKFVCLMIHEIAYWGSGSRANETKQNNEIQDTSFEYLTNDVPPLWNQSSVYQRFAENT